MAFRSHTETFNLLRNKSHKQRIIFSRFGQLVGNGDENDEERVNLVTANGYANVPGEEREAVDEDELHTGGIDKNSENEEIPLNPPRWMGMVDEFRVQLNLVQRKLLQLKELQESHLRAKVNCIFEDGSEALNSSVGRSKTLELEVEELSREVTNLMSVLQQSMLEMKATSNDRPSSRVLANVVRWQCREIMDISAELREAQKNYLNRLNENEMGGKEFVISIDDFVHPPKSMSDAAKAIFEEQPDLISDTVATGHLINAFEPENDPKPLNHAAGSTNGGWDHEDVIFDASNPSTPSFSESHHLQDQVKVQREVVFLESDLDVVRQRDQDVSLVVKSLYELNAIFRDLSTLVVSQGDVLDRIDYNLENVQADVERGAEQIRSAHKSIQRSRRVKRFFFSLVSLILFIVIIAFVYS